MSDISQFPQSGALKPNGNGVDSILANLDKLESFLPLLNENLDNLFSRLSPILKNDVASVKENSPSPTGYSSVSSRLGTIYNSLCVFNTKLSNLHSGVDL